MQSKFKTEIDNGLRFDSPDILLLWETPLPDLIMIGKPRVRTWKRWKNFTDSVKPVHIKHTQLSWNVEIKALPQIHSLVVAWVERPGRHFPMLKEAELFGHERNSLISDLNSLFGPYGIERGQFADKGGMVPYEVQIWSAGSHVDVRLGGGAALHVHLNARYQFKSS